LDLREPVGRMVSGVATTDCSESVSYLRYSCRTSDVPGTRAVDQLLPSPGAVELQPSTA